ncbi:MAG: ABC transporter ATP-binding protein [Bacteroidota bacterium]|jgi:ABC-2 type transport system ATP-binding protein
MSASIINIQQISKKYAAITALDAVTMEVHQQEFFGLLGPNGAGKTTLMNLLVGYLNPDSGTITIDGDNVTQDSLEIRKGIGFVPQSLALYDELTGQENLELFGKMFDIPRKTLKEQIREQLHAVELYDRRKDKTKTYSGGMKRRLNIIASLLHDPKVLLCDEPTVGVDPQSRNAIFEFLVSLNKRGKTIIYTTHYMEEAERLCTRIGIIDHGKIIALGTKDKLLEQLTYEETIAIIKNPSTTKNKNMFKKFGAFIEEDDHFELKPAKGFLLSEFFAGIEKEGIQYSWVELHRPTLEALFLQLTGRRLRD